MTLTDRFADALVFAENLHREQTRKGIDVPYVAHLLAVAATVLEWGGDEETAIAALLHDAVEDQGGLETAEAIRTRFGERVTDIVLACTDSVSADPAQKAPLGGAQAPSHRQAPNSRSERRARDRRGQAAQPDRHHPRRPPPRARNAQAVQRARPARLILLVGRRGLDGHAASVPVAVIRDGARTLGDLIQK